MTVYSLPARTNAMSPKMKPQNQKAVHEKTIWGRKLLVSFASPLPPSSAISMEQLSPAAAAAGPWWPLSSAETAVSLSSSLFLFEEDDDDRDVDDDDVDIDDVDFVGCIAV